MKERKIALIACRILSIYIFIEGIIHISNFIILSLIPLLDTSLKISFKNQIIIISLVPSVVFLALGIILWVKAETFSRLIINDDDTLDDNQLINYERLQSVAFSVVGVIIVINVLPLFIREIPNIFQLKKGFTSLNSRVRIEIICSVIEKVIRLIFGMLLILKANGIVGLIKKLQRLGIED